MAAQTNEVGVTIRLAKTAEMDKVVQDLTRLGLGAVERHDRFAIVNGRIAADKVGALREVAGVASVREDQTYRTL
jgi:hypothetical protein